MSPYQKENRDRLVARITELASQGKTRREIAAAIGASQGYVALICQREKIVTSSRRSYYRTRGYRETGPFKIVAQLFHGPAQSDTELGETLHCSGELVGQVRTWMRLNGIAKGGAS